MHESDHQCVTHKVYDDLDTSMFTPFIGCGKGTSTMNLARATTGASTTLGLVPTTTEDSVTSRVTTATVTRNSGVRATSICIHVMGLAFGINIIFAMF